MDVIEVKASESYKTAHYLLLEPPGSAILSPWARHLELSFKRSCWSPMVPAEVA